MAIKSITGAWRAASALVQADIATAQPITDTLNFDSGGEFLESEAGMFYENTEQITGQLLPTVHRLLNRKMSAKHKTKAYPTLVGLFASMAMGKDTVATSGGASTHLIQLDQVLTELPYRTFVEFDGNTQTKYPGVACVGFTISGARDQFVDFEADLIGSAVEVGGDTSAQPTPTTESYLAYGDCKFYRGGTYDGTTVTGGTELSASLESFKMTFKNNGKGIYRMGDNTGNVGSVRRGLKYTVDLDADFELEDNSHRAAFIAGTEYVLDIPIVGTIATGAIHYAVHLTFPRVVYKQVKKGEKDGILKGGMKLAVLSDPTYGGVDIRVVNLHSASYLAAA